MSKRKGKGLLNKEESKKEFGSGSSVKYSVRMDPLLEGDKLKPGELNMLMCMKDFEAVTDFTSMTEKEKDGHIYMLFGKISKYKSEEYMQKWLSFFIIIHKQTLKAKARRYLNLKKLKLDTWADRVKIGRRVDILTILALSALIGKHTLIHLRNGNLWTTINTVSSDHDELLSKCEIHLAYIGNGLFCELKP